MLRKEFKRHGWIVLLALLLLAALGSGWWLGMKYTKIPLDGLTQIAATLAIALMAVLAATLGIRQHRDESYPLVLSLPLSMTKIYLAKAVSGMVVTLCLALFGSAFLRFIGAITWQDWPACLLLGAVIDLFMWSFGFWMGTYRGGRSAWPACIVVIVYLVTGFIIDLGGFLMPLLFTFAYGTLGTLILILSIGALGLLGGSRMSMATMEKRRLPLMALTALLTLAAALGIAVTACYYDFKIERPDDISLAWINPLDKTQYLVTSKILKPMPYRWLEKSIFHADADLMVPQKELLFSSITNRFEMLGAWYEMMPDVIVHPDLPLIWCAGSRPGGRLSMATVEDWTTGQRKQWSEFTKFCNAHKQSHYRAKWRPGKEELWLPANDGMYIFTMGGGEPRKIPFPASSSEKLKGAAFYFLDSIHLVFIEQAKLLTTLYIYHMDSGVWEAIEKQLNKDNSRSSETGWWWRRSNWKLVDSPNHRIHNISAHVLLHVWVDVGITVWDWVEVTDGVLLGFEEGYIHAQENDWTVHQWGTHAQIGTVPFKEYLDPENPKDALEFCSDGPIFMKKSGNTKDAILFDLSSMKAVPLLKGIHTLETWFDPLWVYQVDRPAGREYRLYDRRDGSDSTIFTLPPLPESEK